LAARVGRTLVSGGAKGIDEGVIEKQKEPAGYIVKQSSLFE